MATQPNSNSIKVANPSLEEQTRTYLTQDVAIGATTIDVAAVTGFPSTTADDFFIILGSYGDEKAEIRLIDASATSGKTFTITALESSHEASDPVTVIEYDKIVVYGLSTLDAVIYNQIATKNIDVTQQFTEYVYTSSSFSFFATAYYNSSADEISGYSETVEADSFTRRSTERIIKSGAIKALTTVDENPNSRLTWDIALTVLQDGLDEISARKKRWPFWDVIGTDTTTVDQSYIDKPTDLTQLNRLKINNKDVQWITKLDYSGFTSGVEQKGQPVYFTERNGSYHLFPTPNSEYDVEIEYYKVPDVISTMSTEVDIPLVPVLIYYCGAQFAYIRGNEKKGDDLYKKYYGILEQQVEEYSGPATDGTPEYVEHTSAFDEVGTYSF